MKLKTYVRLVSLVLVPAVIPLWKFWSVYWTTIFSMRMGWITDAENNLQLEQVTALAWFVFFAPLVLYIAYTGWKIMEEIE